MRARGLTGILLVMLVVGCNLAVDRLPTPHSRRFTSDAGFTIDPRPPCSDAVRAALLESGIEGIARVAAQGGDFTCGEPEARTPLDAAILRGDVARVGALLDAGANPRARWSTSGDRHALEGAMAWMQHNGRGRTGGNDGREIVRLLLRHGASPDARWCPGNSRGPTDGMLTPPCTSARGMTTLFMASSMDDAGLVYLLLDAGADPRLEIWSGASALDYARGDAVFALLLPAMFPAAASRDAAALEYLSTRHARFALPGPWDETPLARALMNAPTPSFAPIFDPPIAVPIFAPPSPLGPRWRARHSDRVAILLNIGADPNQRLTGDWVDWTPLSIALFKHDRSLVKLLLERGADPNARWCVEIRSWWPPPSTQRAAPECNATNGTSPAMRAATSGDVELLTLLLQHGADPTLRDWTGRSALDYARESDHQRAVEALQR
jgi:ankyrin repeat protein